MFGLNEAVQILLKQKFDGDCSNRNAYAKKKRERVMRDEMAHQKEENTNSNWNRITNAEDNMMQRPS